MEEMGIVVVAGVVVWAAVLLFVVALCMSAARGDAALRAVRPGCRSEGRWRRGAAARLLPRTRANG